MPELIKYFDMHMTPYKHGSKEGEAQMGGRGHP